MTMEQGKELSSLDFGAMIGGPLTAVVKAQAQAALSTATFVKQVGFEHDASGNITKAMNVDFSYLKPLPGGGTAKAQLSVPILCILPIPFIQVDSAVINFNAKLMSATHNDLMSQSKSDTKFSAKTGGFFSWYGSAKLSASYSTRRTQKSGAKTEDTYTMYVHVEASQADIPAGMDKVLTILENLIEEKISGQILTVTVTAGGTSGFVVGDSLTVSGGTGTDAQFSVSAADQNGVITDVAITSGGSSYTAADALTATGGSGTGTVTITVGTVSS